MRSCTAAQIILLHSSEVESATLAGVGGYSIEGAAEVYVKIRISYSPSPWWSLAISHTVSRRRGAGQRRSGQRRSGQRQASTARWDRRGSPARSYSEHSAP